jgi:hypothetical protein
MHVSAIRNYTNCMAHLSSDQADGQREYNIYFPPNAGFEPPLLVLHNAFDPINQIVEGPVRQELASRLLAGAVDYSLASLPVEVDRLVLHTAHHFQPGRQDAQGAIIGHRSEVGVSHGFYLPA